MRGNEPLAHIMAALHVLGGRFIFSDDTGNEFVITTQKEFDRYHTPQREVQLPLQKSESATAAAEELLEKINRDIALYQDQQEEVIDDIDEPDVTASASQLSSPSLSSSSPLPPPRRVRFEPIRGDLAPELQE